MSPRGNKDLTSQTLSRLQENLKDINYVVSKSLRQERFDSLCTKNKKLSKLLKSKHEPKHFSVPIIKLLGQVIADATLHYLRYGLNHSFIDKNRHVNFSLTKLAQAFLFANRKISNISSVFILTYSTKTFSALLTTLTKSYIN